MKPVLVILGLVAVSCFFVSHAKAHSAGGGDLASWQDTRYHTAMEQQRQRRIRNMQNALAPRAAALRQPGKALGHLTDAAACGKCKDTTAIVVDLLMSVKNLNESQPIVDLACKAAFANDTEKAALCELLADVVIELGSHALDEIVGRLHFNIPVLVCADIMRLCSEPCCSDDAAPEQVRLSFVDSNAVFADSNGSLRVTWTSRRRYTTDAATNATWQLAYREASATAWILTSEPSVQTNTIGGWIGFVFSQVMTGLRADTTYEYAILDGGSVAAGPFNVTTLPVNAGTTSRPLRILALADMGIVNSAATIARMAALAAAGSVDFVLHYGDMGYADGDEPVWDAFLRAIEPVASRVPYMTTPGNHECFWNFTYYRMRMQMPPAGDGAAEDAMWYGFDVNQFAFSMMDTESFIDTPEWTPMQHAWLSRRLGRANAAKQFNFVAHHRPLYCTEVHGDSKDCTTYSAHLRELMEPLYDAMRVPFVTVGHLHNYERTYPVALDARTTTNYSNPTATVYLVNGAPGNKEGQAAFENNKAMPWSAFRSSAVGFSLMTLSADATSSEATLRSEFVQSSDGAILDAFTLVTDLANLPTPNNNGRRGGV